MDITIMSPITINKNQSLTINNQKVFKRIMNYEAYAE